MKKILKLLSLYILFAGLTFGATITHELSHYYAHTGSLDADFTYFHDNEAAHRELITIKQIEHDGKNYRVETVDKDIIVIYQDTFINAATLNILPKEAYNTGTLGSTFMNKDIEYLLERSAHEHPGDIIDAAPIMFALTAIITTLIWLIIHPNVINKILFVVTSNELLNNSHHAEALGLNTTAYMLGTTTLIFTAWMILLVNPTRKLADYLVNPKPNPKPNPKLNQQPRTFTPAKIQPRNIPNNWYYKQH